MSDEAAQNRARMPWTAEILQEVRKIFGPDAKVTYVRENGHEFGTKRDDGVVPVLTPKHLRGPERG